MNRSEQNKIYNYNDVILFGKFKGEIISERFIFNHLDYFNWVIKNNIFKFSNTLLTHIKKITSIPDYYKCDMSDYEWDEDNNLEGLQHEIY